MMTGLTDLRHGEVSPTSQLQSTVVPDHTWLTKQQEEAGAFGLNGKLLLTGQKKWRGRSGADSLLCFLSLCPSELSTTPWGIPKPRSYLV